MFEHLYLKIIKTLRGVKNELRGQSLVETVILAPFVVFILIGVLEVGWLLRGYIILANANREAARYAVRTNVLHFENIEKPEFEKVVTQTLNSLSTQLPIDFKDNGTMIISYIHADVPCTMPYTITSPLNTPTYTAKFPMTSTKQSWIDYDELISGLVRYQKEYACNRADTSFVILPNSVVIVEMFFDQKQLFGFPVISNPLSDPVPLYTHSIFRKIQESRD